jgi:hypothetical protein
MPVFLPACFQTHYLENDFIPSGKHTVVIMPEQTCIEKENGRKLFEKRFYISHTKNVTINNISISLQGL